MIFMTVGAYMFFFYFSVMRFSMLLAKHLAMLNLPSQMNGVLLTTTTQ